MESLCQKLQHLIQFNAKIEEKTQMKWNKTCKHQFLCYSKQEILVIHEQLLSLAVIVRCFG